MSAGNRTKKKSPREAGSTKESAPNAPDWSARDLPLLPVFLKTLIETAKRSLDLEKIVLFGSRARGDHQTRSDYDLCFFLNSPLHWAEFVVETHENAKTLCKLDLVNRNEISGLLAEEIETQGIPLYDKRKA